MSLGTGESWIPKHPITTTCIGLARWTGFSEARFCVRSKWPSYQSEENSHADSTAFSCFCCRRVLAVTPAPASSLLARSIKGGRREGYASSAGTAVGGHFPRGRRRARPFGAAGGFRRKPSLSSMGSASLQIYLASALLTRISGRFGYVRAPRTKRAF